MTSAVELSPLTEGLLILAERRSSLRFGQLLANACSLSNAAKPIEVEDADDAAIGEFLKERVACAAARPSGDNAASQIRFRIAEELTELQTRFPTWHIGRIASRVAQCAFATLYDIEDEVFLTTLEQLRSSQEQFEFETYSVVFPEVIHSELDYPSKLVCEDYTSIEVPDARKVLQWYFRSMTGGVAYERFVQSQLNSSPNALTRENFENARRITGIGWSYQGVADFFDQTIPELNSLPVDADLLSRNQYDSAATAAVARLTAKRGIKLANATKLLYQKRPGYFPIFDSWVRQVMNIPYVWDTRRGRESGMRILESRRKRCDGEFRLLDSATLWLLLEPKLGAFGLGLKQFRYVAGFSNNRRALNNLDRWFRLNLAPELELGPLSLTRILDIVAWSTAWFEKNEVGQADFVRPVVIRPALKAPQVA